MQVIPLNDYNMRTTLILRIFLLTVVTLLSSDKAFSQWILQGGLLDQQIHRGIELTYNMQYSDADRTFDSVIRQNPEHPSGYFYKAMVNFWRAVTNTDNTGYFEANSCA